MAKATAVKTAKVVKRTDYRELRACIECTLREHLMMDKEVRVVYMEYETWMGTGRKLIIESRKAGTDIIRSGSEKSILSTNGYYVSDLPPLPKDPIRMIRKIAEKMGLKVLAKSKNQIVIKK
jgi:hypothetical protein